MNENLSFTYQHSHQVFYVFSITKAVSLFAFFFISNHGVLQRDNSNIENVNLGMKQ